MKSYGSKMIDNTYYSDKEYYRKVINTIDKIIVS